MNTEQSILDLKFKSDDLDKKVTIRQFFYELMKLLWEEKECFDGKRPFGNSGWDSDLITCLVKNKLVEGELDEDGFAINYDYGKVDKFILNKIIKPIFGK